MEINLLAGTFVESIFYWHGNYKYLLKYAEAVDAALRPFFSGRSLELASQG